MPFSDHNVAAGVALLLLVGAFLGVRYWQRPHSGAWPGWGSAGLGIILVAGVLLALRVPGVTTFFTPIVWTGYTLLVDALVFRRTGRSRLAHSPRALAALACWSVPLWLVFEAYNLRLANWAYVGVPQNWAIRLIGYAWSFATIWPAIFETADLVEALDLVPESRQGRRTLTRRALRTIQLCGLGLVVAPLVIPLPAARYLFGAVWVGFALLLDPLTYELGGRSLLGEWERGQFATLAALLTSGLICGLLWEFWNYWASAKWVYVFPIAQHWKIFEMPVPGFLGFPPFAVECFVMYEVVQTALGRARALIREPQRARERVPGFHEQEA